MDPAVLAQLNSYIGKEDFAGHMKEWRNNLMEQQGDKWVAKDLPNPNGPDYELNDEEFEKLLNRLIDLCKNDDDNWGEFYK